MNSGQLKNMVVLKNLPSNIIEEVYVVLKANKKVKNMEYIKKNDVNNSQKTNKDDGYIIKEAEMIVTNYMNEIEKNKKDTRRDFEKKYNTMKYISFALAFVALVEFIII